MDNECRCRTLEELLRKYELRGMERGEREQATYAAKKLLADGRFTEEEIARYSGLTVEEIMKLKEQYEG